MTNFIEEEKLKKIYKNMKSKLKTGADRISKEKFSRELDENIKNIVNSINNFEFKVHKYKNIKIDDNREVVIPTIKDQLIANYLKIILESDFNIKYPSRDKIIRELIIQLEELLNMKLEDNGISFIKIDLRKCFNNISKPLLLQKLKTSLIVKPFNEYKYYLIKEFLKYQKKGVPQGIGLSNLLVEFFLKDFDNEMKKISNKICYYARYVDDIIILFNGFPNYKEREEAIEEIHKILAKYQLKENKEKSINLALKAEVNRQCFSFLGYDFNIEEKKNLKIEISSKKLEKLFKKIDFCFSQYLKSKNLYLLKERLNFLLANIKYKKKKYYYIKNRVELFSKKRIVYLGIFNTYNHANKNVIYEKIKKHLEDILLNEEYSEIREKITNEFCNTLLLERYISIPASESKCLEKLKKINKKYYKKLEKVKGNFTLNREYLKKVYLRNIMLKNHK